MRQDDDAVARRMPIRVRNAIVFCCIAAAWVIIDQVTKALACGYEPGQAIAEPLPGMVEIVLAHNTGGAWSLFGDMTIALAVLSIVICSVIVVYLFALAPDSSVLMTVGLALVFGGGIGNLIDRLTSGYVIDLIKPLFIDFPIFNVADIGVTCGAVIVLIALAVDGRRGSSEGGG